MSVTDRDATTEDTPFEWPNFDVKLTPQAAVAELGQAALIDLDISSVFELALTLVCDVLDVEFAKVLQQTADNQPLVLRAGKGWNSSVLVDETTVPIDRDSQAGYTLMRSEPVIVENLGSDIRFNGPRLLTDHDVASGISVVIPGKSRFYGILGIHTAEPREFTSDDADFLRSIANIIGSAIQSNAHRQRIDEQAITQERRLRYQGALAECARALLASEGEERLRQAVAALLAATQATYVFVERNEVDPELGLCSRTVIEMEEGDDSIGEVQNHYWDLVPWTRMPTSRSHLEKGEHFVLIPSELDGPEYEQYLLDPDPIRSELDIPIFADGKWAGLIGFADSESLPDWTPEDLSLLTAAATMIGAFWERETGRERLEQMIHAKNVFLASVSHELRTPLTAVVGFGQILRDEGSTLSAAEHAELLDMVINQSTDVTNIVNDLLVAAKADIGTLEVSTVPVNLHTQATQVLDAFDSSRISQIDAIGLPVRAIGDPDRVRQIIRNLITNAVRYGGHAIAVRLVSDGVARVLVCDNGTEIPEQDQERIFQAYQRAHNAPGIAGSLGLGLAISRQLARLMNGDLTYRYENHQSVFELTLPIAIEATATNE